MEAIRCDNDGDNINYGIGTIDFNKIIPVSDTKDKDDVWNTRCNAFGFSYHDKNVIEFETINAPPYPIIEELSEMFSDIKIDYIWSGDYYTGYCGEVRYENGFMISSVCYRYMDVTIDVPPELGYPGNKYGLMFAPEMFGIARSDSAAIKAYAMESAVEGANRYGR